MDQLPTETMYNMMLEIGYDDLMAYRNTNTAAADICGDDTFWRDKYQRDFNTPLTIKVWGWRQVYEDRRTGGWLIIHGDWRTIPSCLGVYRDRNTAIEKVMSYLRERADRGCIHIGPRDREGFRYSEYFLDNDIGIIGRSDPNWEKYQSDITTYYRQLEKFVRDAFLTGDDLGIDCGEAGIHLIKSTLL